ncbi:MAG TPA: hypothetical protein PKB02_12960 [Anaerohalosphaeraceae bacterium]|nr:hypothetical protein [Anaerohalosphaeraceae bacterium]
MDYSLYKLLEELSQHHLYFTVASQESDSIVVGVDVPGQHWKIEFFASGKIKTEIFKSNEDSFGEEEKLIDLQKILNINIDGILKSQVGFEKLFAMLNQLHLVKKNISMAMHREGDCPVMVKVEIPGQYWEIEFFESGEVQIEVFISDGKIYDQEILPELIKEFAD